MTDGDASAEIDRAPVEIVSPVASRSRPTISVVIAAVLSVAAVVTSGIIVLLSLTEDEVTFGAAVVEPPLDRATTSSTTPDDALVARVTSAGSDRSCDRELRTLVTAVDAYIAMNGEPPAVQGDLVRGGLLRGEFEEFEVTDGYVDMAEGVTCVDVDAESTLLGAPDAATPVDGTRDHRTVPEQPADDPTCTDLDDAVEGLGSLNDENIDAFLTDLTAFIDQLSEIAFDAPTGVAADLSTLVELYAAFETGYQVLADAREGADARTAAIIDDLMTAGAAALTFFPSREAAGNWLPALAGACELRSLPAEEADESFYFFGLAISALLDTDLGADESLAIFAEFALDDRGMTSTSGMSSEFSKCARDPDAEAYGSNPGCDALWSSCAAGDLLACDDLYWASPSGTEYERFGATCGERVALSAGAAWGYCEELER